MPNYLSPFKSRTRVTITTIVAAVFIFLFVYQTYFTREASALSSGVVISQVYGGGGNAGATYRNDFIELFNRGNVAVNLSGWSVQYASSAGTTWAVTSLSAVSLQPGQYYLVQEAVGAGGTINLPTPDATGTIAMSATAGKVALVNSTTALTGSGCPFGVTVVDFVGYGGANCFETAPTAATTNTTAALRGGAGCNETDSNSADFATGAPTPRNTASTLNPCGGGATNPSGVGTATPNSVAPTATTLLTVTITAGTNPTSTAHTVSADLSSIGGSASQTFFDNGSNGDVNSGDNIFSFNATVANGTTSGLKNLGFTITETAPQSRSGSGSISLTVLGTTNPTGVGASSPNSVLPGENSVLTVTVTPGTNPPSSNITVTADLTSIGGLASQSFFDDGSSGGDVVGGNNVFTFTATVDLGTTAGVKTLPFTISDDQGRNGSGSIALTVQQPPPPVDHVVISQLYGGGGNTGATFTNDFVELYNPTGVTFNLAGWSVQYASAGGNSWTNKQPIGGTIAPGEYFLVSLGSGGAVADPLPVSPNISGDINMSATTGKVALVSNSTNLTGTCPNGIDPDIVDFVGYGGSANCFEGAGRAPAPSNSTAILRKVNGSQDTNQNIDDFQTGAPNPRRTAPIVELGPWVAGTDPIADSLNAPYDATVTIDFSESVNVSGTWYDITCTVSGQHSSNTVASFDNFKSYHITPNTSFTFGEQCTVTVIHTQVQDQDLDDSTAGTDTLFADHVFTFTVTTAGTPAPYPPSVHLTMGNPSNAVADLQQFNNYLMEKPSFALSYNRDKGTPNWVSWHLEPAWFGSLVRVDTFRADPQVPSDWYRVQGTDYFSSGFDRGHMTPNADRDHQDRRPINQETYLMSNIVPQTPDNNQGPWANQENDLRAMLTQFGEDNELYIISGPLGVGGSGSNGGVTNTLANGQITVPAFTWKVVLLMPRGENDVSRVTAATKTISIMMPNIQGIRETPWQNYLTTVDAVEQATGYDFFSNLPDIIENAIEAGRNGVNPPGTQNQGATTSEDTDTAITLSAVSPQANPTFTSEIVSPPSNGIVSGTGLNLTYTPAPHFNGPDSFTFRVNDGSQFSNTSTVSITVTAVNDAPSANSQAVSTDGNTPVAITLTGSDIETATANLNFVVTVNPTHGTLSGSGANLTYTPALDYSGPDSFKFTVTDTGDGSSAALTSSEATVSITVNDTIDPTITAPGDINLGTGPGATICGLLISDGTLGTATANDNSGSVTVVRTGVPAGNIFPVGITIITYTATDGAGNSAQDTQTVVVTDTTAPTLTLNGNTITLSPPNHNYQTVNVSDLVASASDNCDTSVDLSKVVISKVTSDETENGNGSGDTINDIVIAADCKSVQLRAERQGGGDGRVYVLTFKVTDQAGNYATKTARVSVLNSSGQAAIDSGVKYTINGTCP